MKNNKGMAKIKMIKLQRLLIIYTVWEIFILETKKFKLKKKSIIFIVDTYKLKTWTTFIKLIETVLMIFFFLNVQPNATEIVLKSEENLIYQT